MRRRKVAESLSAFGILLLIAGCPPFGGREAPSSQSNATLSCRLHLDPGAKPVPDSIYGLAAAPADSLRRCGAGVNRWGGNTASRYNWRLGDAWNTGKDWYFSNVAVEEEAWRKFVDASLREEALVVLTVPLVGWVAKDTASYSFSVEKYGPQQETNPHNADAGNGILRGGNPVRDNDPEDASIRAGPDFVAEWLRELVRAYPQLHDNGRLVIAIGNEPMLWHVTHRDVHPEPVRREAYLRRYVAMARRVREVMPRARIAGPEVWGWPAYFRAAGEKRGLGRKTAFLPWFLGELRALEASTGERLLDILTVHYYPQARGVFSPATGGIVNIRRAAAPRSLYDPGYEDPSWIATEIRLLHRLREWVDARWPGTRIGITEFNWGAEAHISGALALADCLGAFGRHGLDLACYWTHPPKGSMAEAVYRLFRNADGEGARFGDQPVRVEWRGAEPEKTRLYAAIDGNGVLTLIALNKSRMRKTLRFEAPEFALKATHGAWILGPEGAEIRPPTARPRKGEGEFWMLELPPQSIQHLHLR